MANPSSEQKELLSKLEDVASMIQKAQVNLKKCPKQRLTIGYVKARLKSIEDYWSEFKLSHHQLSKCTTREQRGILTYFLNEDYFKVEELCINLQADLTDILIKLESTQRMDESMSSNDSHATLGKLPKIQLPIFSGKYEEWHTYKDLFTALVHNANITNVQKLQYLKLSVSGEAEVLLRQIQITECNYTEAWELLKRRFENKKMIVNAVLKRLFGQKKVVNQSANQIKGLLDTTTECLNNLKQLNIDTNSWDCFLIFLIGQKLDLELLKDWEEHTYTDDPNQLPTWEDLKKFLETKYRTLELIAPTTSALRQNHKSFHVATEEEKDLQIQTAHTSLTSPPLCTYCNHDHYIFNCKDFTKQPVEQRHEFVRKNSLCYNCLVPNHNVYRCRQKTTCRICRRRHHTLLHQSKENAPGRERQEIQDDAQQAKEDKEDNSQTQEEEKSQQKFTAAHFSKQQTVQEVLLATAQILVMARNGVTHVLRALIDQGSEASFVSARAVDLLGLKRTNISGTVSGVGEGSQIPIKYVVDLAAASRFAPNQLISIKAFVLKNISTTLPSKHMILDWPELKDLNLADPTYSTPSKIDILLGADVFGKIIEDGLIRMGNGIVAQKTNLGWILSGQRENIEQAKDDKHHNFITMHATTVVDEKELLKNLWELDANLYKKKKILTKEEEMCENIYRATTRRDSSGRYVVHLPLKNSIEDTVKFCGNTKEQAIRRFKHLERKFENNEKLKEEYLRVIREYKDMGHMIRSDIPNEQNAIYLPHHAVVRDDKETTKVRVVFDASALGSNNHSLNDSMMIGPVLQPDLRSLITTWRTHRICIVGDIVKMYRMVKMTEEHTDLQRIVWRDNPNQELEVYNLTTVTFGTSAAPFLAVRTLIQLADDEAFKYPETAPLLKTSFYMDDLMTGSDSIERTKQICEEIKTILKKGGFEMQKWSSNSDEVLKYLSEEEVSKDMFEIKLDKIIKILGMTWNRNNDAFEITVNLPEVKHPITKRSIVSDIARLFDPFGWLSPVVITAKIFIQKLWQSKVEWDDVLSSELSEEWVNYREELIHLKNVKIPRWMKITPQNCMDVELHGFSDASTQAYAAVIYVKVIQDEKVYITMIAAKSRVAPLKQISVPRLELCAAALLAELMYDLMEILQIPENKIFAWTDSTVVLSWLQSEPNRWRTFVANRVADITRLISKDRWRHVDTADNPADLATRGVKAECLHKLKCWWTGPEWLQSQIVYDVLEIPQTGLKKLESKKAFHNMIGVEPIWERFSSLTRMKRVLAYCRRMLKKDKTDMRENYLTTQEMETVLEKCITFYQDMAFGREIQELRQCGQVRKRSTLITLSPFLDKNGLIRVGGRLNNASISESSKHPIIIPGDKHITKLLVREAHAKTLHGGIQLMISYLRTRYWIIGLKSAVKACIRNCKTCIIDKAKVKHQFMGQLPSVRVNQHRPFQNSGVDYAGPVQIRTSKGRGHHSSKGYICLFVCMATRAIHLEAVTDLTSQAFLAAFRRFVSRRGHCMNLWSDNGTNFVGAAKELKFLFDHSKDNITIREVAESLAIDGTTWHFIPPKMPSYGGLWEAGVQSAKRHLTRVNKDTKLTYEEMATLLTQVEACLNSRPICVIDSSNETPLTPAHFLVGEPLVGVPDVSYEQQRVSILTRWQLVQRLTQDFWRRWQAEYLNTLQQRYKWQVVVPGPTVGDLVIVKEDNLPPTKWMMGRIKSLHPGADNHVRVVTVQCKGNQEFKRPLYKLIPLPTNVE